MPRRSCFALGAAALIATLPAALPAAEAPPSEVLAAAEAGLPRFVRGLTDRSLAQFGFQSRAEAASPRVSQGFRIYTVDPADVLETPAAAGIDSLAVPTDLWQFLVTAGERTATLLTVGRVDGRWTAVSLGAAGLAGQLDGVLRAWPASAGYDCRVIRVYQAASDFVEISRGGLIAGVVPLTSARVALGLAPAFDPADLRDSRAVVEAIRPAVRANLETGSRP
jgi:hypothetical protein